MRKDKNSKILFYSEKVTYFTLIYLLIMLSKFSPHPQYTLQMTFDRQLENNFYEKFLCDMPRRQKSLSGEVVEGPTIIPVREHFLYGPKT